MNKFLIVGLIGVSNLLLNAEDFLPKSNNPYYYIQKDHPVSLDTYDNDTYYYIQRLHPSSLNTSNDAYYFTQMNEEDKKKVISLDILKDEKELELKKELLMDEIDWNKVGNLNKEIENIKADIDLMILKEKYNSK